MRYHAQGECQVYMYNPKGYASLHTCIEGPIYLQGRAMQYFSLESSRAGKLKASQHRITKILSTTS